MLLLIIHEKFQSGVWYVDIGCNNHMCGSKSSFSYLNTYFLCIVSFVDCSTVNVLGQGDIKIKTKNGLVETISNVFYVHDLKSNLLSAGQFVELVHSHICEPINPTSNGGKKNILLSSLMIILEKLGLFPAGKIISFECF